MVLNFGGSESSSQGLLLTHLTTCTLAHLHHTHNCTIVPHTHTHSVMAPPIHLGAWSMAMLLLLPHTHNITYTCIHTVVPNAHIYVRTYTLKHTHTQIYLHSHTFYHYLLNHSFSHPHTPTHTPPSLTRIQEIPGSWRGQDVNHKWLHTIT